MITLFIGRFQPFHKGHLHDIKNALKFSDKVIIGIGSSQEENTSENPFSFDERKEMIGYVLRKNNISVSIFAVPDINDDSKWVEHVISITGEVDIVYTGNGWVRGLFESKGYPVKEVIEMVREVTGHPIPAVEVERRSGDPVQLVAGSDRIKNELGWEPRFGLKDIESTAWQWHKNHPDGY